MSTEEETAKAGKSVLLSALQRTLSLYNQTINERKQILHWKLQEVKRNQSIIDAYGGDAAVNDFQETFYVPLLRLSEIPIAKDSSTRKSRDHTGVSILESTIVYDPKEWSSFKVYVLLSGLDRY